MTAEFHNWRNAVWNAIQQQTTCRFVVADVCALDGKVPHNAVNTAGAIKQDLLSPLTNRTTIWKAFPYRSGTSDGAWIRPLPFAQLPRVVENNGRDGSCRAPGILLFDRMVAFHIQRGEGSPLPK
jgi:hypothetical protein